MRIPNPFFDNWERYGHQIHDEYGQPDYLQLKRRLGIGSVSRHSWLLFGHSQIYLKNEKHNSNNIINNVIKYIKDNLLENLSLTTLSSYANLSPIHFHNTFKASTGKTLREYVESERIKKACDLLVTTDYTLTRISEECGFSSQSYFSFAFRRKMNLTPREYAKQIFNRYEKTI